MAARATGGAGSTIPDICFAPCTDAYKIFLDADETLACTSGSDFDDTVNRCYLCIEANTQENQGFEESPDDIYEHINEVLQYCEYPTVFTSGYLTMTDGQVTMLVYAAEVPSVSSSTITTTTASAVSATTSDSSASTTTEDPNGDEPTRSSAWIAGPVVGSVIGLALIIGGLFYFWRRRRKGPDPEPDQMHEKAQLHSDCVPRPPIAELRSEIIYEIEAPTTEAVRYEKPVNEVPARELPS